MEAAYTVALVGFAQHESATFESFFRLAARRPPAYRVQEEVLDAQLLLVNADNAQAVALVVNGFCKEVLQALPMEFAMEAQSLVAISLEGSVG